MSTKGIQIGAMFGFVLLTGWAHAKLPLDTRADLGADFVPAPAVADAVSLGFDALLADYYWLQAVQVAGARDAVDEPTADHLGRLVDVTTTLNPHVGHPYRFAAVWMTFTREQVGRANALLERAIAHHPEDWRNYFYLGFNHFYYLGDYEAAADALETATSLPGSPGYLPRLVARLKSQTGDIDVAEVFLRQLLEGTEDEEQQAKYLAGLDEIEIERKARFLDRAAEAYRTLSGNALTSVDVLVTPPHRVIETLPRPEPEAMPEGLSRGSVWEIGDDGRIYSTYVGGRYEVHYAHHKGTSAVFSESTADAEHEASAANTTRNTEREGEGA